MVSAELNLIIRADANAAMGTGHVMRCLALAQGWQERGGEVLFAGNIPSRSLQKRILDEGFDFVEIRQSFPAADDLETMVSLLKKGGKAAGQWVVIDGYHFTADYSRSLQETGAKVLVLDDYAHQDEYQADLLLNQNLGSEQLAYKINADASILAGANYVLLRREFLRQKDPDTQDAANIGRRILVTLGGSDPENVSLKVIEALEQIDLPQLEVKVVVGPSNLHLDLLERRMGQVAFKGELLTNVKDMVPLMKWADVAVTAGGSTCWELAYLGVPSLILSVANNQ